jgi:FtsZ-binding cell division protein ZapB
MAAVIGREPETKGREPENDTLGHLEERIQKAVALVQRLRQEKDAALKELAASQDSNARLSEEVESLQAERLHVRNRLEKLLGHIDQLGPA